MIKSVEIINCLPFYGMQSVNLRKGLIHVAGQYESDENQSNRSGKSSFLRAIFYALYGEGKLSELQSIGTDSFSVRLIFDDDTIIQRGSEGAFYNGERLTHTMLDGIIAERYGMTKQEFLLTVGMFGGNTGGFLDLSPTEQKRFLEQWQGTSNNWGQLYVKARSVLQTQLNLSNGLQAQQEILSGQLKAIDLPVLKEILKTCVLKKDTLEMELNQISTHEADRIRKSTELKLEVDRLQKEIEDGELSEGRRASIQKNREQLDKELKELQAERDTYQSLQTLRKKLTECTKHLVSLETTLKQLQDQFKKLATSKGVCPLLEQDCPYTDELLSHGEKLKLRIAAMEKEQEILIKEREERECTVRKVEQLEDRINTIGKTYYTLPEIKEVNLDDLRTKQQAVYARYIQVSDPVSDEQKRKLYLDLNLTLKQIANTRSTLTDVIKKQMELNKIEERLNRLKERQPMLQVAARLLAPSGLPYLLSIPVLNTISTQANDFLKQFDTQITILPYKELQRLEDRCPVDGHSYVNGNELVCPVCKGERRRAIQEQLEIVTERNTTYPQESSGGKTLINLAVRLALLSLYRKRTPGAKKLPLILDEVFSHLDDTNRVQCLNTLLAFSEALDIDQIFLVTHDDLKYDIPTTLTIMRDGTKSRILV